MSEDQYKERTEDKDRNDGEKDVEGHAASIERNSDGETDEPDVEGHSFTPPATTPQQSSIE